MAKKTRSIELPPVTPQPFPDYIEMENGFIRMNLKGKDVGRFRQLHADLVRGAVFTDGRSVGSKVDVIRWLLEQASGITPKPQE